MKKEMSKASIDCMIKNVDPKNEWAVVGPIKVEALIRIILSFWNGEKLDVSIYCHIQNVRELIANDDFLKSNMVNFLFSDNKDM